MAYMEFVGEYIGEKGKAWHCHEWSAKKKAAIIIMALSSLYYAGERGFWRFSAGRLAAIPCLGDPLPDEM